MPFVKKFSRDHFYRRRVGAAIMVVLSAAIAGALSISSETMITGEILKTGQELPQHLFESFDSSRSRLLPCGRKTAILFFTMECPHCQTEISNLLKLYQRFKDSIEFVAISLSAPKETADLEAQRRLPFTILQCDPKIARGKFRILGVPVIYLVDEGDTIRYSRIGKASISSDFLVLKEFLSAKWPRGSPVSIDAQTGERDGGIPGS